MYDPTDPASIERRARRLVGRRFGEVTDVASDAVMTGTSRGSVGHLLERFFGLSINSDAGPDFAEAGVELKSVPMVKQGNTHAAKERTYVTAIDYGTIARTPFEGSPLDTKTRHTLYVFYAWEPPPTPIAELRVLRVLLHERDDLDELVVREAYEHVQRSVLQGRAHELSESDTWGIGPATKDARARDITQPVGDRPARRRAFAWRPAYTTRLFQIARLTEEPEVEAPGSLEDLVRDAGDRLLPWYGTSVAELRDRFTPHVTDAAKNLASTATRALLGADGGRQLEAFDRLGVTVRTVRVDASNLRPFEAVSFAAIDFEEVATTPFEASPLQQQLNAILFTVFTATRSQGVRDARLWTSFLWRPTAEDLEIIEEEYEAFRHAIATRPPDAWPRSSETTILHVRPHGRNKQDRRPLPTGGDHVRSAFWLNQGYLQRLVRESRPL